MWHAWPNSAACWSPAMPAMGRSAPPIAVSAQTPDDGTTRGSTSGGMSSRRRSSSSHAPRPDVEEQRATGIRWIGHVRCAAGQVPDEPAVDRSEGELAACGPIARARNVVEQPLELRPREIGVDDEPRLRGEQRGVTGGAQCVAHRRGAPILPDDRIRDRLARRAIPEHRRLALVGDADGREIARRRCRAFASASCMTPDCVAQISIGSCSTHPGCGKICRNSCCATARTVPAWSNTSARELVVPWSRARTNAMDPGARRRTAGRVVGCGARLRRLRMHASRGT